MKKQHGHADFPILLIFALVLIILTTVVYQMGQRHPHTKKMTVVGELLMPTPDGHGRYAYKADDGDWWIYYWVIPKDGSNDGYSATAPLPSGGQWSRLPQAPEEDEIIFTHVEEQVTETDAGEPETEAEVENQSIEPESTVESSEPSESPADSDAGGDD